jgi:hypothetical protein
MHLKNKKIKRGTTEIIGGAARGLEFVDGPSGRNEPAEKADFIIKYNSMALFVPQYRVPEKTSTPTKPKPVGDL